MVNTMDLVAKTPTYSDFEAVEDALMYMGDDNLAVRYRSPSKAIPMHVWDAHRPVIEKLYIEDGLKLSEVCDFMERNYGFLAA